MKKNFQNGFTLIELLVVIAIIGILASVVIASVGSSKDKAVNTAIKKNVDTIKTQILLNFSPPYDYSISIPIPCVPIVGSLFNDPIISTALNKIENDNNGERAFCASTEENWAWAVSVKLKVPEKGFTHWCVDSFGTSKLQNVNLSQTKCED